MANEYFRDYVVFDPSSTLHFVSNDAAQLNQPKNELKTHIHIFNKGPASLGQNVAFKIKTT